MEKAKKKMKKKKDWQTKEKKRNYKQHDKGIIGLLFIIKHFFKYLPEWIDEMEDPRNQSYITYTQADYIYMGILKNICGIKTMHSMEELFNESECIRTLGIFSGNEKLKEMPHSDSLNYYLKKLSTECLSGLRRKMVKSLLRKKIFNNNRAEGKYWRIILDGTGLYYFKEKHCENCLMSTWTDKEGKKKTVYYHKVLEAKLVLSEKIVISIDTEFIENESENVAKQDCETKAAKRLLERLKKEYPRLPLCIQADNLYETEPMMKLCREKGFEYLFTHKEGHQKEIEESYQTYIREKDYEETEFQGKEKGRAIFVNHVEKATEKIETANIFEYSYEKKSKSGEKKTVRFCWITSIELTKKNIEEMVKMARGRWKIENEGFNNQKNGIYDIEHLNSRNSNAMKNHYLLTQIADIIMQIYLSWNPVKKETKESIKNTSSKLLESFRRLTITDEDVLETARYTTVYLE